MDPANVHDLTPDEFFEQVHSFEHWFGAVEDYLADLEYGRRPEIHEAELSPERRDGLVGVLCNYAVAETTALEVSAGLVRIAPNRHSKIFLSTQVVDEGRHLEVVMHRMKELGVADPEAEVDRRASPSIQKFRNRLLELVDAGEWDSAIFAQNVVLECMEYSVFRAHARIADPVTSDLLERMSRDERRHIGFGENELGRRLRADPRRRLWVATVKTELDRLVLDTFDHTMEELGIPRSQRPQLGRDYLEAVERLGVL